MLGGLLQAHLFHGTTEEAIVSICRHGFDPEHASFRTAGGGGGGGGGAPKMFGLGLYLASNATKSAQVRRSNSCALISSAHVSQQPLFAGA